MCSGLECKFIQKYTMTASIIYDGDLRCLATHLQSGTVIQTDAPSDNQGKGERFSPTDLTCVSLATCMITTMAIKSKGMNLDLKGTTIEVTKHMLSDPRRIGRIDLVLRFASPDKPSEKDREYLEMIANNCPVAKSIHPEIEVRAEYLW